MRLVILVKCRKKAAKNWGNKSKKEGFEGNVSTSLNSMKKHKSVGTHKKVGMKMKGGKLVNDCVQRMKNFKPKDRNVGRL